MVYVASNKRRPHQQQCRSYTFDFVERIVGLVPYFSFYLYCIAFALYFDNVASTLLLVWTGLYTVLLNCSLIIPSSRLVNRLSMMYIADDSDIGPLHRRYFFNVSRYYRYFCATIIKIGVWFSAQSKYVAVSVQ